MEGSLPNHTPVTSQCQCFPSRLNVPETASKLRVPNREYTVGWEVNRDDCGPVEEDRFLNDRVLSGYRNYIWKWCIWVSSLPESHVTWKEGSTTLIISLEALYLRRIKYAWHQGIVLLSRNPTGGWRDNYRKRLAGDWLKSPLKLLYEWPQARWLW